MRKLAALAAGIAFTGGAQIAAAADLSYKDTPYEVSAAPIWAGFYVGGHVGGLWNDSGDTSGEKTYCNGWSYCYGFSTVTKAFEFGDGDNDATLMGGVHIGYNFQDGAKVYGIEGDLSFGDGVDYLASLRGRLGYAYDNILVYATAGVAFAGFEDKSINLGLTHPVWKEKTAEFSGDSEVGLVVGAGAEYKLSSHLSVGVEGLYYFFDDSSGSDSYEEFCRKWGVAHEDDNDLFVVRARMTYHLQDAYDAPLK